MSLQRYKELESCEKAIVDLKKDTENFMFYGMCNGVYLVHKSNEPNIKLVRDLQNAVEMRDDTIAKVREYEHKNHVKVFEW